jgi:NTP pyrophosphatase (non-canonical NTP hydrolase)
VVVESSRTAGGEMNLNEYQDAALKTALEAATGPSGIVYTALGLNGEAGEYAEKVKKHIRDGSQLGVEAAQELGDLCWYLAVAAWKLGYTLDQVAQMNLEKLASRQQRSLLGGSGDDR